MLIFDTMQLNDNATLRVDVKRIAPSINEQGWRKCYATQWQWYWQDEHDDWRVYGKQVSI